MKRHPNQLKLKTMVSHDGSNHQRLHEKVNVVYARFEIQMNYGFKHPLANRIFQLLKKPITHTF